MISLKKILKIKLAENERPSFLRHILTSFRLSRATTLPIQRYLLNSQSSVQSYLLFFPLILRIEKSPKNLILQKTYSPGPFESIWQRFVDFWETFLDISVRPTYEYCLIWPFVDWLWSVCLVCWVYLVVIYLCNRFTPKMLNRYHMQWFLLTEFSFYYLLAICYHYYWAALTFSDQGDFLLSKPLVLSPMLFLIEVIVYYCFFYERPVVKDEKTPYKNKAYQNQRGKNKIFKHKMIIKKTTKKKWQEKSDLCTVDKLD